MRTRWIAAAAALLSCLASLGAQSPEKAPRRLLVAVEAGSDAWSQTDVLQVSRSLLHAIEDSGARILLLDWGSGPFPADGQLDPSVLERIDCWLLVSLEGQSSRETHGYDRQPGSNGKVKQYGTDLGDLVVGV